MRQKLTDALIRTVPAPRAGRVELVDDRAIGLVFRVTSRGVRTWCFRFRDPATGRSSRFTIGPYPAVSLADARSQALELRASVSRGTNPTESRRTQRTQSQSRSFGALSERYIQEHACRFKRSAPADERNLRLHVLPYWRERPYLEIRRSDVIAISERLIAAGKSTNANRVQALISSIFSFAVDADLIEANPCFRLRKRAPERPRTRVLSEPEIRAFWYGIVLPPVSRAVGLALRLALLTGARVSEIAGTEVTEFERLDDIAQAGWRIPATRTKNRRGHFVPLSALARETVMEAVSISAAGPAVFQSPRGNHPIEGHTLSVAMQRFGQRTPELTWSREALFPHAYGDTG